MIARDLDPRTLLSFLVCCPETLAIGINARATWSWLPEQRDAMDPNPMTSALAAIDDNQIAAIQAKSAWRKCLQDAAQAIQSARLCQSYMNANNDECYIDLSEKMTTLRAYFVYLNDADYLCGLSILRHEKMIDRVGYETKKYQDLQIASSTRYVLHYGLDALGVRCIRINSSKWSPAKPDGMNAYQGRRPLAQPPVLRVITDVTTASGLTH